MSFFTRISATKTPAGETYRQCRQIPATSGNLLNASLLEDTNTTLGRLQPRAPSSFFIFFYLECALYTVVQSIDIDIDRQFIVGR